MFNKSALQQTDAHKAIHKLPFTQHLFLNSSLTVSNVHLARSGSAGSLFGAELAHQTIRDTRFPAKDMRQNFGSQQLCFQ